MIEDGAKAPAFTMPTDGGGEISLAALQGKRVVLYFYPRDDTPGCTKEACAFRDLHPELQSLDAVVIGVSKDTAASHDKFKAKYELPFTLAADTDGTVCEAYGVWVEKNMYGRKSMGIERATFLIDETGTIRRIWRKVKVDGHAEAVKAAIAAL